MSYQQRVDDFMRQCFGAACAADKVERNHRFLEEALELVQSTGCTRSEAHQLVDYVFGRPVGDTHQEVGGVTVTLSALCSAADVDMQAAAELELTRVYSIMPKIRAKQAAKPKFGPLPAPVLPEDAWMAAAAADEAANGGRGLTPARYELIYRAMAPIVGMAEMAKRYADPCVALCRECRVGGRCMRAVL